MLRQLHSVDSLFLHLDTAHSQMDVTPMYFYDPSTAPDASVSPDQITAHIHRSVEALPILRSRVERAILDLDNPYLVEDRHFDLRNHLRQVAMPEDGDWEMLCGIVTAFQDQQLDLERPPWEILVVHGISGIDGLPANCFLMMLKIHHVIVDGHTIMEMTEKLHDEGLARRAQSGMKKEPGFKAPELLGRMTRLLSNNLLGAVNVIKPLVVRGPKVGKKLIEHLLKSDNLSNGPVKTRFNHPVSDKKVWGLASFSLAEFKAISKSLPGATINHVVLTVITGALRHYLASKHEPVDQCLRAIAPINVRKPQDLERGGNEIALFFPDLPVQLEDPVERFNAVSVAATRARKVADEIGAEDLSDMAKHLPPAYLAYLTKLGSFASSTGALMNHAGHTLVTNVPGPAMPLHLAGAQLVQMTGVILTVDNIGLLHAINSYAGKFNIAWTCCAEMMPDPEFYRTCMEASFDELKAALLGSLETQLPAAQDVAADAAKAVAKDVAKDTVTTAPAKKKTPAAKRSRAAKSAKKAAAKTATAKRAATSGTASTASHKRDGAKPVAAPAAETTTPSAKAAAAPKQPE